MSIRSQVLAQYDQLSPAAQHEVLLFVTALSRNSQSSVQEKTMDSQYEAKLRRHILERETALDANLSNTTPSDQVVADLRARFGWKD